MAAIRAALGTSLSQAISVFISFVFMAFKDLGIKLEKSDLKLKKSLVADLLKIGLPISLQDGFIQ